MASVMCSKGHRMSPKLWGEECPVCRVLMVAENVYESMDRGEDWSDEDLLNMDRLLRAIRLLDPDWED
jgi:hypothetical protein